MPEWVVVPLVLIGIYGIAFACLYALALAVADDVGKRRGEEIARAILEDRKRRGGQ